MKEKSHFQPVLKNKSFLKVWISQILSQITLNLVNFTIILRIFEITKSTVAVSLVWFFYVLPVVLLSPFSGTIVDFGKKKKILTLTNLFEALIVLGYLLIEGRVWMFYSVVFFYAIVDQFYIPAEGAILPSIVPRTQLPAANTLFMFAIYATKLVGFSIAGTIMKLGGENFPFILGSIFLSIAAFSVSLLPRIGQKRRPFRLNDLQSFFDQIKEGYLFIRSKPGVLFPLLVFGLVSIILHSLAFLTPSYATEILKIDLLDAGLALILPAGIGAILGARSVVGLIKKVRKKKLISLGLFLAGSGLLVLGLINPLLPQGRVLVGVLTIFFLGISYSLMIIPSQTLIQEETPEKLRGRVFAVLGLLITLAAFLPVLMTATMADVVGAKFILALVGLFLTALAYYTNRKEPYEAFLATSRRP